MSDDQLYTGEEIRAKGYNPDTVSSIGGKFKLSQFTGGGDSAPAQSTSQEETIRRAIEMQREAAQPAIQSLEAGIPEVQRAVETRQAQLQAEQAPLTQRYNDLITSIRQTGQRAGETQTRITSGELGKRGLTASSTLAQQELQRALEPITERYLGLEKETAFERESALRDLANQITNLGLTGTEQQRAIRNAIAQLQSGAGQAGITTGISQYQTAEQLAAQKRADDWAKRVYEETTLPLAQRELNKPYSSGGSEKMTAAEWLEDYFAGKAGTTNDQDGIPDYFVPDTSTPLEASQSYPSKYDYKTSKQSDERLFSSLFGR